MAPSRPSPLSTRRPLRRTRHIAPRRVRPPPPSSLADRSYFPLPPIHPGSPSIFASRPITEEYRAMQPFTFRTGNMRRHFAALMGLLALTLFASAARAELRIDITNPTVQPVPIAVTDFFGQQSNDAQQGANIASVVSADLERSGLFKPIDRKAFIQTPDSLRTLPRFGDWRVINAQALVSGVVETQSDGRLRVEFRLWDVYAEQQMIGEAVTSAQDNWRAIS